MADILYDIGSLDFFNWRKKVTSDELNLIETNSLINRKS